uniref:chaperone protein DnaJ-like n=1 Tax=Styela clava TaxID=7725 RepID=UPI0019393D55|nr:chaperone protein DnaJ-like [Styela clava]
MIAIFNMCCQKTQICQKSVRKCFHFSRNFCCLSRRTYATHYDTLGISSDAKSSEIKEAYIKKTKEHHPDTGQSDNVDDFLKISEAYEVLSNPSTRRQYDFQQYGKSSDYNRFKSGEYNIPRHDPEFDRALRYQNKKASKSHSESRSFDDEPIKMALSGNARVILDYLLAALISISVAII